MGRWERGRNEDLKPNTTYADNWETNLWQEET